MNKSNFGFDTPFMKINSESNALTLGKDWADLPIEEPKGEAEERKHKYLEEEDARDNHWKTLANEYLKLVSATEFFANVILENNEELSEIAWRDGYSNVYDWVEWVYDPDKDYSKKDSEV